MKVLQFAFDSDGRNEFLPRNYDENCVAYTGTHDNNTTRGWYASASFREKFNMTRFIPHSILTRKSEALIRCAQESPARVAVIPMQDYLDLGEEACMNMPSTLHGNWEWRATQADLTSALSRRIRRLCANRSNYP
jgi:4-alpha-glucanotransferase